VLECFYQGFHLNKKSNTLITRQRHKIHFEYAFRLLLQIRVARDFFEQIRTHIVGHKRHQQYLSIARYLQSVKSVESGRQEGRAEHLVCLMNVGISSKEEEEGEEERRRVSESGEERFLAFCGVMHWLQKVKSFKYKYS